MELVLLVDIVDRALNHGLSEDSPCEKEVDLTRHSENGLQSLAGFHEATCDQYCIRSNRASS
jgi:hypothetical protein